MCVLVQVIIYLYDRHDVLHHIYFDTPTLLVNSSPSFPLLCANDWLFFCMQGVVFFFFCDTQQAHTQNLHIIQARDSLHFVHLFGFLTPQHHDPSFLFHVRKFWSMSVVDRELFLRFNLRHGHVGKIRLFFLLFLFFAWATRRFKKYIETRSREGEFNRGLNIPKFSFLPSAAFSFAVSVCSKKIAN